MGPQPSPRTERAVTELRDAETELATARAELHAAVLADLAAGVRQADLVRATGYTRERLRQLERESERAAS